jgi:hypothetical protein
VWKSYDKSFNNWLHDATTHCLRNQEVEDSSPTVHSKQSQQRRQGAMCHKSIFLPSRKERRKKERKFASVSMKEKQWIISERHIVKGRRMKE